MIRNLILSLLVTIPSNFINAQPPCAIKNDFTFTRNPCNPLAISFLTNSTGYNSISWNFGDGNTSTGSPNPSNNYLSAGNYLVVMIQNYGSCIDTVTKQLTVDLQTDNQLLITPDTTMCFGSTKQLLTTPSLSFCWNPVTYLNNPNLPNPITSTPQNITYYYSAEVTGANLIINGNFSSGNTGFTSQYNYANPNTTEGEYFVGPNPQAWNSSTSPCPDHTSGNGNMMLVNGAPIPNVRVWTETVAITPNTNYVFSTWIQAIYNVNPAQLQFSINGNDIGTLITASLPVCTWTQFYTTWNSGNNNSATISVVNKNTMVQGNDFALDDISFAPVHLKRDSVKITVDVPVVTATNSTGICSGTQIQLNATGAATYSWAPTTGLNNPNIANPIATPVATTEYIVTGTTINGCIAKDTVDITLFPNPVITKSNDVTICPGSSAQLLASGGVTYSWSPAGTLNNAAIPNPLATPVVTTTYHVTVTDANTCNNTDSIKVTVRTAATFAVNPPLAICKNKSVQLNASGGDIYSWSPAGTLNNPAIQNPVASPANTTAYSVNILDTVCGFSTNLSTTVTILPLPNVRAGKSNDIDCSTPQSMLTASGASQYSWSPAGTLNNPNSASPIATPTVTTQYNVSGTDFSGCINSDSVIVKVLATNSGGYLMPNAFTPNNDGKNDCYGIKYWGTILRLQFSIYNRWGERIFYTTDPNGCWDGTINGVPQDPAVFVYMIKAKTSCQSEVFRKGTFVLIR